MRKKYFIIPLLMAIALCIEQHTVRQVQANPLVVAAGIGAAEIPQIIAGAAALISTLWYRAAEHEHSCIAAELRQTASLPITLPSAPQCPPLIKALSPHATTPRNFAIELPKASLTYKNPLALSLFTVTQTPGSYRLDHADGFSFEVRVQPHGARRHRDDAFTQIAYEQALFERAYQQNPTSIARHFEELAQALIGCNSNDLIERIEHRLSLTSLHSIGYVHYHLERTVEKLLDTFFSRDGTLSQTDQFRELSNELPKLFKKWGIKESAQIYAHPTLQIACPKKHSWLHALNPFGTSREKILSNPTNAQLKQMIEYGKSKDFCSARLMQIQISSPILNEIAAYYTARHPLPWSIVEHLSDLALYDPLTRNALAHAESCRENAGTISTLNARAHIIEHILVAWHIKNPTARQLQALFTLISTPALSSPKLLVEEIERQLTTASTADYQELAKLFYTEHGIARDFDHYAINAPKGLLERESSTVRSFINAHIARILEKPDKNPGCGKAVEHAPIITIFVPPHDKVSITTACFPDNPLKHKNDGCKPLMPHKPILYFTQDGMQTEKNPRAQATWPDEVILEIDNDRVKLIINHPVTESIKTGSALKEDDHHAFPDIVDNYARYAYEFDTPGGDGILRKLYQIAGSLNGKEGIFEWMIDPNPQKGIVHRRFLEDREVTGIPNQRKKI